MLVRPSIKKRITFCIDSSAYNVLCISYISAPWLNTSKENKAYYLNKEEVETIASSSWLPLSSYDVPCCQFKNDHVYLPKIKSKNCHPMPHSMTEWEVFFCELAHEPWFARAFILRSRMISMENIYIGFLLSFNFSSLLRASFSLC